MTTADGRVMFVAAHPDDPEFLAGGTIARLAKEGREITYVIGSGRHARTYLHRSPGGEITELPVSWYTQEKKRRRWIWRKKQSRLSKTRMSKLLSPTRPGAAQM